MTSDNHEALTPDERLELGRVLMPDADFLYLFNQEYLETFRLQGDTRHVSPTVYVFGWQKQEKPKLDIYALQVSDYNIYERRLETMRYLGRHAWAQETKVCAVLLASEAWIRAFTPQEHEQRGNRLVETYDDKQEVILVVGTTTDRMRWARATAVIHRDDPLDDDSPVQHMEAWNVTDWRASQQGMHMPLLEAFFAGYHEAMVAHEN